MICKINYSKYALGSQTNDKHCIENYIPDIRNHMMIIFIKVNKSNVLQNDSHY